MNRLRKKSKLDAIAKTRREKIETREQENLIYSVCCCFLTDTIESLVERSINAMNEADQYNNNVPVWYSKYLLTTFQSQDIDLLTAEYLKTASYEHYICNRLFSAIMKAEKTDSIYDVIEIIAPLVDIDEVKKWIDC